MIDVVFPYAFGALALVVLALLAFGDTAPRPARPARARTHRIHLAPSAGRSHATAVLWHATCTCGWTDPDGPTPSTGTAHAAGDLHRDVETGLTALTDHLTREATR